MKFSPFAGVAVLGVATFYSFGCASNATEVPTETVAVPAQTTTQPVKTDDDKVQTASVAVTEKGYEPASLDLKKGVPARLTFTRKTDSTCGTEVVLPDYKINQKLPLNKPVVVSFTPEKSGTFAFTCGMNMLKGQVVVK